MRIQHNMQAMNGNRMLDITNSQRAKTAEKLASGYQINRAADDAAGLSISEKMRKQIRGLDRGCDNVSDGISFCQVADGALAEVCDMLNRMKVLSIQSANGTNSPFDREAIDKEVQKLKEESERIFLTTSFNEKLIWGDRKPPTGDVAETIKYYPVTYSYGAASYDVTDKNVKTWPKDGSGFYLVEVAGDGTEGNPGGMQIKWDARDGNSYTSDVIPWPDPQTAGQSINLADHFTTAQASDPKFQGLNCNITYRTTPYTTIEEVKSRIFNVVRAATVRNRTQAELGGATQARAVVELSSDGIAFSNVDLNDHADTTFAQFNSISRIPNNENNNTDALAFTFNFVDRADPSHSTVVRTVPASFTLYKAITDFNPNDRVSTDDETRGISYNHSPYDQFFSDDGWWGKTVVAQNGRILGYNNNASSVTQPATAFTPKAIADVLVGNPDNARLGGLLDNKNGVSDEGVQLKLNYNLVGDNGKNYGSFSVYINGSEANDKSYFLNHLSNITEADIYSSNNGQNADNDQVNTGGRNWVDFSSYYSEGVQKEITLIHKEVIGYKDIHRNIHSAPEADMEVKIFIDYACLSNLGLGIEKMNVLTIRNSEKAMDQIDEAARIVVGQRSLFGAYQNRLEHTTKNLDNVVENTQAAESRLRDADMADEMVKLSMQNILQQSGQSILAQANQTPNGVMSLLQQ